MWPYALFALAGTAATALGYNGKCHTCGDRFSLNLKCVQCDEPVCSGCSNKVLAKECLGYHVANAGRCCITCNDARTAYVAQQTTRANEAHQQVLGREAEERRLVEATKAVVHRSKNYQGKVEHPRLGQSIEVARCFDQESARLGLSRIAAEHDCSVVVAVEIFKDGVREEGNFKQATWGGRGVI